MIQQMIYRRSEQGYRTVAASEMLVGKSLCRHIESLSTLAPSSGQKRLGVDPVYSRCAVEKGLAVLMTAVDPGGIRGSHITHAWYVPEQDTDDFAHGNAIPANKFIREYRETSRMDVLPCAMPKELCREDTLSLGCSAAKALFGKDAELLAQFLTCVIECGQPVADRGFLGVCALTDAEDASLNAYRLMETVLRAYAQQQVGTVGYRSMWNRAEDNVRYPVFFTTPDLIGSEASVPMNYVLFDLRTGAVRLPRGMKLTCDAHSQSLAQALLSGNATGIRTLQQKAEEEFARLEQERREAESFHVEPNVQYSFRPTSEPEQQNVEQQRTHEVAQHNRHETAPVHVEEQYSHREAASGRVEEQRNRHETAPVHTEKQYSRRETTPRHVEEQRSRREPAPSCVEPKRSEVHYPLHSTVESEMRRTAPKAVQAAPVQTYPMLEGLLKKLKSSGKNKQATMDEYLEKMAKSDRDEDYLWCAAQLLNECVAALNDVQYTKRKQVTLYVYPIAECTLNRMATLPTHPSAIKCRQVIDQINDRLKNTKSATLERSRKKWFIYLSVLDGVYDRDCMTGCTIRLYSLNKDKSVLKDTQKHLNELACLMLEEYSDWPARSRERNILFSRAALAALYAQMRFKDQSQPERRLKPMTLRLKRVLRKIRSADRFNKKLKRLIRKLSD